MSNIRRFSNPALPQKVKVTLVRDGFNQPWGFRLAGGTDVGYALTIQRVSPNYNISFSIRHITN